MYDRLTRYNARDIPPQSWKIARIAARAFGLHWPFVKNLAVSSFDMLVQTAGQLLSRATSLGTKDEILGKENAAAVEVRRMTLVKRILNIDSGTNLNSARVISNGGKNKNDKSLGKSL